MDGHMELLVTISPASPAGGRCRITRVKILLVNYIWCREIAVQISVTVAQRQGESDVPTLKLVVESLGVKLCARDFDTSVNAYLGGIYVQHMLFKGLMSSHCSMQFCINLLQCHSVKPGFHYPS